MPVTEAGSIVFISAEIFLFGGSGVESVLLAGGFAVLRDRLWEVGIPT